MASVDNGDNSNPLRLAEKRMLTERALAASAAARQFGADAIRMTFLVNGGALIAILALLGSTVEARQPINNIGLICAIFGVGLICATISAIMAYLSQNAIANARLKELSSSSENPKETAGRLCRWGAIAFLILSVFAAAGGAWYGADQLNALPTSTETLNPQLAN